MHAAMCRVHDTPFTHAPCTHAEAVAASKPSTSNTTNGAFTAQDNKLYEGPAVPSGQHSPRTHPDALTIDVRQSPKHSSPRHAFPESLVFLDARYSARVSPDSSGIAGVRRSPRTADHGGSTHSTRHQSHSGVEPRPPSRLCTSEGLAGNERRPPSRRVTSEALSGEARRRGGGFDGSPTATAGARGDRRHRSQAQVSPDGTSGGDGGGGGMFELRPLSAQVRSHEGLLLSPPHSGSSSRTHEGMRTYEGMRTQEGMAHSPRDGSRTQEGVAQSPRDGSRRQEGVRTQEGEAGSRDGLGMREGSRMQDGMGRREGSRSHADMVRVREGLGSREGSRTQQGTGAKQGNGLGSREGSRTQQGMGGREGSRNLEGSRTQEAYAQWMEARVPSNVSAASSSAGGRAQPADGAAVASVTSVTPRQGSRTADPRPASRVRVPDQGSGLSVEPRQGSRVRALEGLGAEPRRLSSVRADGLGFDPHPPPSRSNTSDSPRA